MKIQSSPQKRTGGFIAIVFIALLAIMMILVMAESRSLIHLRRETKFLEQQQIKRLNAGTSMNQNHSPVSK